MELRRLIRGTNPAPATPGMEPGIFMDELLKPEVTTPEQFQAMWHGGRPITPERALVIVVLWQAAGDLRKFRFARSRKQQRLYMEAYKWVASDDRNWPYSFVNLCETLDLSPQYLRAGMLEGRVPATKAESPPVPMEEAA
jgi:hypothetical protein